MSYDMVGFIESTKIIFEKTSNVSYLSMGAGYEMVYESQNKTETTG